MEYVPTALVLLLAVWLLNKRLSVWIWAPTGLVLIMGWLVNSPVFARFNEYTQVWRTLIGITYILYPSASVAVMALLIRSGMDMALAPAPAEAAGPSRTSRVEGLLRLAAALGLLVLLASTIAWASIWDQTTDGLGGLYFNAISVTAALVCGLVMAFRASSLRRLVGLLFMIVVILTTSSAFTYGWQVSFPHLTEQRAGQVAAAIQRFRAREDRYPASLNELVPRDLLVVPRPVMFQQEDWCYQAANDGYRLAAFYHEYFGLPVSLEVYAQAGDLDGRPLPCDERLAEMQARYDWTHLPVSINE